MKELIEQIAKALVDNPEQVSVRPIEGEQATVFELRVAQSDLQGNREARANSGFNPNYPQCSGNEAEEEVHA